MNLILSSYCRVLLWLVLRGGVCSRVLANTLPGDIHTFLLIKSSNYYNNWSRNIVLVQDSLLLTFPTLRVQQLWWPRRLLSQWLDTTMWESTSKVFNDNLVISQVRANVVLNTEEQITDYVTISGVENDIRFGFPYVHGGYRPRQSRQSSTLNNNGHTAVSTFL